MATLSSRSSSDSEQKYQLQSAIDQLLALLNLERAHPQNETVEDLLHYLQAVISEVTTEHAQIRETNEILALQQTLLKLELIELENLLAISGKAINQICSGPPNDEALDEAANTMIDVMLNTGNFSLDFNDNLVVDDTSKFNKDDIKSMLSVSISRWLELKQDMIIV